MTSALNSRRALLSCCCGLGAIVGAMALASCAPVPKPAAQVQPLPPANVGPPQIVAEVQGEIARVLLVRAWRFDSHTAKLYETPSGIGFEFLVLRQPRATGEPSAKPIVGITVDGRDYAELSKAMVAELKKRVTRVPVFHASEPLVGVDYLIGLRLADGRRTSDAFGLHGDEAFVFKLAMAGVDLGSAREVGARIEVGWGGWIEPIVVSVPIEALRSGPMSY